MQKTPRSQVPALESTKKVSIHTYGGSIHAKMTIWPFFVNFGGGDMVKLKSRRQAVKRGTRHAKNT